MATELGGTQITSLMETLPGIANVLRSPVADALVNAIRAAARLRDFQLADAKELIQYATRRGLLGNDEGDRVLAEVTAADLKRQERLAARGIAPAPSPAKAPPLLPKPAGKPAPLTIGSAKPRPPMPPMPPKPVAKPVKAVLKHPAVAAKKPQPKAPPSAPKKPVKPAGKKKAKR